MPGAKHSFSKSTIAGKRAKRSSAKAPSYPELDLKPEFIKSVTTNTPRLAGLLGLETNRELVLMVPKDTSVSPIFDSSLDSYRASYNTDPKGPIVANYSPETLYSLCRDRTYDEMVCAPQAPVLMPDDSVFDTKKAMHKNLVIINHTFRFMIAKQSLFGRADLQNSKRVIDPEDWFKAFSTVHWANKASRKRPPGATEPADGPANYETFWLQNTERR
ncbi:hypothetical protein P170DRAFT_483468 [Aspergillus steynii IBT 23096]|uniref:Uncharacterized protein n=1 Tax=Aspergillus steynii IBT 23096 TaxID=1392250 RepID=A0A2I2GPD6_9EURO|nr:uncharacterized protein P170DRAFT_483468 [Aspergillus steynii IBT 23096]PLB54736.1 hypothetical protein P170DRAFT_483468 [Aspergillus steynii IBT 23096]